MDYIVIWKNTFRQEAARVTHHSNILQLAKFCLTPTSANAKSETIFSFIKILKNLYKTQVGQQSSEMGMIMDGKGICTIPPKLKLEVFCNNKIGINLTQKECGLATRAPMKIQRQKNQRSIRVYNNIISFKTWFSIMFGRISTCQV